MATPEKLAELNRPFLEELAGPPRSIGLLARAVAARGIQTSNRSLQARLQRLAAAGLVRRGYYTATGPGGWWSLTDAGRAFLEAPSGKDRSVRSRPYGKDHA